MCSFWSRNASLVVKKELERLIDYTDFNVVNQKFSSITTSGCTLIAGANQGQGTWRFWMKISTMSNAEIKKFMDIDANFDPKKCYIILQVAYIICKKDHHDKLSETVSDDLSAAYETLQASSLVFIQELEEEKVKSFFIPKHAYNICIEEDDSNFALTYFLQTATENGFSVRYAHKNNLRKDSVIILIIPHFNLYSTGDLTYYCNVLGMPNSVAFGAHSACCQE